MNTSKSNKAKRIYTFGMLAVLEQRLLNAGCKYHAANHAKRIGILLAWERWMHRTTGGRFGKTAIFCGI